MKEKDIIKQIDTVNDMLKLICQELNKYEKIDDYEMELDETEYTSCNDIKKQRSYILLVTCKNSLKGTNEIN